jgi:hypothetical protein
VPLARDLHPEFGYVGSAPRMLKVGYVSAFVVFGLVAVVSSVTVFMAAPDRDPINAMALAPAEALSPSTSPSLASPAKAKATEGQEILNAGVIQSPCRDDVGERLSDDCASERMRKSRPVLAVNERPAIAAVAIGHREDPVAVTPQLAAPVAAIPEPPQDASAVPVDVAPATDSLPTPAAKHSRTSSRHVARREGYSHSARPSNHAGGYAGLW